MEGVDFQSQDAGDDVDQNLHLWHIMVLDSVLCLFGHALLKYVESA